MSKRQRVALLSVDRLAKSFSDAAGTKRLFDDLSFELAPRDRLAVLGRNGQGKSTLIKILGGVMAPTSGKIRWRGRSSWPLGFGGAFQGGLTGVDNIRFIARIYGRAFDEIAEKVDEFAELGEQLYIPVKHYSAGMRARLAFGLSLAIEFDCYLIDEVMAVGDGNFRDKCERELFHHRGDRAFIMASHDLHFIRGHCTRALVIESGRTKLFEDVDLAVDIYQSLCEPSSGEFIEVRPLPASPARLLHSHAAAG